LDQKCPTVINKWKLYHIEYFSEHTAFIKVLEKTF
jgi:hypothetical protein